MMAVAGVGIAINAATAWLFMRGRKNDLNIRGAFLHMAADALVSAGVVVAGALSLWMHWTWLDPVVSLAIGVVILLGTWGLFKESLHLLFDGVPDSVDPMAVRACLEAMPGVSHVDDLALLHKSKKVDMTPTPDAATPQQAPPPLWGTQVA